MDIANRRIAPLVLAALLASACNHAPSAGTSAKAPAPGPAPAPSPARASESPSGPGDTNAPAPPVATQVATAMLPAPGPVSDTIITGKVKAVIASDNGMKGANVSVTTNDGIVALTGNVKSPDQSTLAQALAQRQEGVHRVESRIAVE